MNKLLIIVLVVSTCVFGRTSTKHQIVGPPDGPIMIKTHAEGNYSANDSADDDSLRWKRRHKRRKKSRRPQRGR